VTAGADAARLTIKGLEATENYSRIEETAAAQGMDQNLRKDQRLDSV
jgi:hypothetical protein